MFAAPYVIRDAVQNRVSKRVLKAEDDNLRVVVVVEESDRVSPPGRSSLRENADDMQAMLRNVVQSATLMIVESRISERSRQKLSTRDCRPAARSAHPGTHYRPMCASLGGSALS